MHGKMTTGAKKENSFLFSEQRCIVWLGWGREAGRKMGARCHLSACLTTSCSSQLYFPAGAQCGHSVLHVCFPFSFGIPETPAASLETLLRFLLEAGVACGILQDGLNGCCPLSSASCCGIPVSPVQRWLHFPPRLCCPSPALLALGGVLALPGV